MYHDYYIGRKGLANVRITYNPYIRRWVVWSEEGGIRDILEERETKAAAFRAGRRWTEQEIREQVPQAR